jgi:hypothetical protein
MSNLTRLAEIDAMPNGKGFGRPCEAERARIYRKIYFGD